MTRGHESSNANDSTPPAFEFAQISRPVNPSHFESEPNSSKTSQFSRILLDEWSAREIRASAVDSGRVHVGVGTRSRAFDRYLSASARPRRHPRGS